MSELWKNHGGAKVIQPLNGQGYRIVESQEQVATTQIVANIERQNMLEKMLDAQSKPPYREGTEHLHVLLSTPFRYPPLNNGSRFGNKYEPSLFYGGTTVEATLCESAFYRFYLYHDMEVPPEQGTLQSQHTLFEFSYGTERGVKLHQPPFDTHKDSLRDKANYRQTQALGTAIRNAGVEAVEFISARDKNEGINVALYQATSLTCEKPTNNQCVLCQVDGEKVVFSIDREVYRYAIDDFMLNGTLPMPAA